MCSTVYFRLMTEPKRRKKTNSDTWKSAEREIAKRLGAQIVEAGDPAEDSDGNLQSQRVPVTGRGRGNAPDIQHPRYSLEVKHGKQVPALLVDAMDQAVKSIRGERIPMVVFHPHGGRYDDSLVIIRIKDLPRLERGQ